MDVMPQRPAVQAASGIMRTCEPADQPMGILRT